MIRALSKIKEGQKGLTLVEILLTVFVLSVGILSSLLYFTTVSASNELAKEVTIASNHGEYVFEEMRLRPSLSDITSTDWSAWAISEVLATLPGESITVTYLDSSADPLQATAVVSWQARTGTKTVTFLTELTK